MNLLYFQGWQSNLRIPFGVSRTATDIRRSYSSPLHSSHSSLVPFVLCYPTNQRIMLTDWEARLAIMSLRSVLRKLGTNRSTYSNIRSAVLGASQSAAVNNNFRNPEAKPVSSVESSAGYCCHHVSDDGYLAMQSRTTAPRFPCSGQEFDYYINLKGRGLEAARFATQEFNKQKNAQLQFVRMLCANRRRLNNGPHYMYFILLEAMDGGELKVYQAHVSPDFTGGMSLQFLGHVVEKGSPVKLFDPLDDFWD